MKKGVTVVELLIVIAIFVLFIAGAFALLWQPDCREGAPPNCVYQTVRYNDWDAECRCNTSEGFPLGWAP